MLYWNRDGFLGLILLPFLIEDGPLALDCMCVPFTSHVGMNKTDLIHLICMEVWGSSSNAI